ncbi:MAG: UPF0147 family protein [Candidatus Micrarchaeota archaeon]
MAKIEKSELEQIIQMLDVMVQDNSIPRNVRARLQEAQGKLKTGEEVDVAISSAVYALDEVSNDINLPMHARTMIWSLMSELEGLKNR